MHGGERYGSRGHGVTKARGGHSFWLPTDRGGGDGTWGEGLGAGCGNRYLRRGDGIRVSGG
jgi:hypothetical protein